MKDYALAYRKLGWSVVPVKRGTKHPAERWKPWQTKLPSKGQIEKWWQKYPDAGIAVITGPISNLVVIDFDSPNAIEKFIHTVGEVPESISAKTGRPGGRHVYLKWSDDLVIKTKTKVWEDIDVKGKGGVVVVPPTIHPEAQIPYQWENIDPIEDGLEELADPPVELIKYIKKVQGGVGSSKYTYSYNKESDTDEWFNNLLLHGPEEGSRNNDLVRATGKLLYMVGDKIDYVRNRIFEINSKGSCPPLPEEEIYTLTNSIYGSWKKQQEERLAADSNEILANMSIATPLTHLQGVPIKENLKMCFPDGTFLYRICFEVPTADGEPRTHYISVTPSELGTLRFMSDKLAPYFNYCLKARLKTRDWDQLVDRIIAHSEEKEVAIEESELGPIFEIIRKSISNEDDLTTDIEMLGLSPVVVLNNNLIVTSIEALARYLSGSGAPQVSRQKLGQNLVSLGFRRAKRRVINRQRVQTWELSMQEFDRWMEDLATLESN